MNKNNNTTDCVSPLPYTNNKINVSCWYFGRLDGRIVFVLFCFRGLSVGSFLSAPSLCSTQTLLLLLIVDSTGVGGCVLCLQFERFVTNERRKHLIFSVGWLSDKRETSTAKVGAADNRVTEIRPVKTEKRESTCNDDVFFILYAFFSLSVVHFFRLHSEIPICRYFSYSSNASKKSHRKVEHTTKLPIRQCSSFLLSPPACRSSGCSFG